MNRKPAGTKEIYLQPGGFHFGTANTRIGTLLGSCVSITMWHPSRLIGGMCHFMLPSRNQRTSTLEGKYADEAMDLFMLEISRYKTAISDYQVKIFGGGMMFPKYDDNARLNVSDKNVEAAYALLEKYKIEPATHDVGSAGHRRIVFDVWSGNVWVRYQPLAAKKPSL